MAQGNAGEGNPVGQKEIAGGGNKQNQGFDGLNAQNSGDAGSPKAQGNKPISEYCNTVNGQKVL